MGALIIHILFVAFGAIIGAATGWLLRGGGGQKVADEPAGGTSREAKPQKADSEKSEKNDKSMEQLEVVMSRLHQLTASVAADVGEHSSRVQAINDELTSGGDVVSVVERLMKVNEQMQSQLQAAEQRMQQQAAEIESHVKEARTDALTKLANRRAFDDEIRRCVDSFKTKSQTSCVMMVDVDHFKKFNDTYGHQAGDEVLRNVGRVLRREATGKEIVCRYGGEEFAVIYPGMDLATTIPLAEKSRAAIGQDVVEFQGLDLKVTASGGVAQLQPNESGDALVKRADIALYACKESGRNCGFWHDGTTSCPMNEFPTSDVNPGQPAESKSPAVTETRQERAISRPQRSSTPSEPTTEPVFKLTDDHESSNAYRRDRIAGLSDYPTFCRDLDRRLAAFQRDQAPTSLLFISVDGCDKTADTYGTKAVELVKRTTAQIVKATMREMDHGARIDEQVFALLLPGSTTAEACLTAERIRAAIEACPLPVNGDEVRFTVSMGVVEFVHDDERERVLDRARLALDGASSAGGNRTMSVDAQGECHSLSEVSARS